MWRDSMVTEEEAITLAKRFVATTFGSERRCYGAFLRDEEWYRKCLELLKTTTPKACFDELPTTIPPYWAVEFELIIDSKGDVIDGSLSVMVDAESGKCLIGDIDDILISKRGCS
jgi:hypothetical protein